MTKSLETAVLDNSNGKGLGFWEPVACGCKHLEPSFHEGVGDHRQICLAVC